MWVLPGRARRVDPRKGANASNRTEFFPLSLTPFAERVHRLCFAKTDGEMYWQLERVSDSTDRNSVRI